MSKLILFDIDETMLLSDGVGRRALSRALSAVCRQEIDSTGVPLSGKTDPQICREILQSNGLSLEKIEGGLPLIYQTYLPLLKEEIANARTFQLHVGVEALLAALMAIKTAHLALLTGNIEAGARLKLEPFSLNRHFHTGAYGCDSANRMNLPEIATNRAADLFKVKFQPQDVVIIGDSVNDVRCAQGFGARSVAVATGKTPWRQIEACNPDYLFRSLADTETVLKALLN